MKISILRTGTVDVYFCQFVLKFSLKLSETIQMLYENYLLKDEPIGFAHRALIYEHGPGPANNVWIIIIISRIFRFIFMLLIYFYPANRQYIVKVLTLTDYTL